jgi:hypothetical protein
MAAEDLAAKVGASVSQYIAPTLAEKTGARATAEFFAESKKGGDPERAVALLEGRPE